MERGGDGKQHTPQHVFTQPLVPVCSLLFHTCSVGESRLQTRLHKRNHRSLSELYPALP